MIRFVNEVFAPPGLANAIGFATHDTTRKADWGRVEVAPETARLIEVLGRMAS